ncbi:MAG: NF038122 family metalloprotease [Capsulimonadales bacterium]|nr:NF038122 family metalloprotease [Capsulimonadales bacterium]
MPVSRVRVAAATACSVAALGALMSARADAAFDINLIAPSGINPLALQGFQQAAALWESVFTDDITVNIQIDFAALGPGVLGSTNPFGDKDNNDTSFIASYAQLRNALGNDATSVEDGTAVANLQTGNSLNFVTNNSAGASVVDTDGSNNNSLFQLSGANAKALGLIAGNDAQVDAFIAFSTGFSFDFDPTNGINGSQFDFVGIAAHEIGHALGFVSGVDFVDYLSGPNLLPGQTATNLNNFAVFNPLDLFRYSNSALTLFNGNRIQDLRQGRDSSGTTITPFFSLDGTTELVRFATGLFDGDGRQASHWKDNLGLGIMDPTAGPGERLQVGANDLLAFDVIGYNLPRLAAAAPVPGTLALLSLPLVGIVLRRRKRNPAH